MNDKKPFGKRLELKVGCNCPECGKEFVITEVIDNEGNLYGRVDCKE